MATTKIWNIKGRLDVLINYAANADKTDGSKYSEEEFQSLHDVMEYAVDNNKTEKRLYVSSVNVTPDTARDKMMQTKSQFNKMGGIVAFHAIQSFKPGEVTPELAHNIGMLLAEELWGDRFEVIVATHLNKHNLHNHFVLNSVSFVDGNRYYDNKSTYKRMRQVSDRLCEEHGLSVIKIPQNKGKHYAEWKAEQEGLPTIRGQIRDEIDEIINCSYTYKQFLEILQKRGYELKIGANVKYPAVKPTCSKCFVRLKSLGERYTEDKIKERIAMARNGIKEFSETKDYNDWIKKYEATKLKGFIALYYHYLYLFGKIRKKETPQRVSFYMREELIKFDRYGEQFRYLYDNGIETAEQLKHFKESAESKIFDLTFNRGKLYNKPDTKSKVEEINKNLRRLRKEVRTCNNIFQDSRRIQEHQNYVTQLEQEAKEGNKLKNKNNIIRYS